jgi:N-acetylglutamate synthase-like GNAT family acetyltransferase
VWLCRSAIRHPIGNFAIGFEGAALPEQIVDEALQKPHFRAFFLPGDRPDDIEQQAEAAGLRERYVLTGMVLDQPRPDRERIIEAETPESVERVTEFITNTFFWRSHRRSRQLLSEIMAAAHPEHRYFYLDDKFGIVAAGTLTLDAEVIGLYNLCVRGDARSQGIGSSFTTELSHRAKELGDHVALLCDDSLVPWYSRQGYRQIGSLRALSA